jgi:hypothetical protein
MGVSMDRSAIVICSVRPLKGSAFIFAISLAFAFYSAPPAARAAEAEAVTIDTNFTVYTPPCVSINRHPQPAQALS